MATKKAKEVEEKVVEENVKEVAEQEVENVEEQEVLESLISDELIGPDGEELLFPNGPSVAKVEEWKSLYNGEVYLTEFEEEIFLWRPMSRQEYKKIMKVPNADNFYKEERICETVILFPERYNFQDMSSGKAGIPTLLSEYVMAKSGFQPKTDAMRV